MPIKLGSNNIAGFYLGVNKLNKIYLGNDLVWQAEKVLIVKLFRFDTENAGFDLGEWFAGLDETGGGTAQGLWFIAEKIYPTWKDASAVKWTVLESAKVIAK